MHKNHANFDLDTEIINQDNAKSYCLYLLRQVKECFLSEKQACIWEYTKKHNMRLQYCVTFSNGKDVGFSTWTTDPNVSPEVSMRDVFRTLWAGFRYWIVDQWKLSLEPFEEICPQVGDLL
jgi:hypothetical protein